MPAPASGRTGVTVKFVNLEVTRVEQAHVDGAARRAKAGFDPIVFGAVGNPGDGKAFVTVIRAFALVGRLGDRLLVQGCGGRRSRLIKWAKALRVDGIVTFVDGDDQAAVLSTSATILLSITGMSERTPWWATPRKIIRVTLANRAHIAADTDDPHFDVPAGEVLALCQAMHAIAAVRN